MRRKLKKKKCKHKSSCLRVKESFTSLLVKNDLHVSWEGRVKQSSALLLDHQDKCPTLQSPDWSIRQWRHPGISRKYLVTIQLYSMKRISQKKIPASSVRNYVGWKLPSLSRSTYTVPGVTSVKAHPPPPAPVSFECIPYLAVTQHSLSNELSLTPKVTSNFWFRSISFCR